MHLAVSDICCRLTCTAHSHPSFMHPPPPRGMRLMQGPWSRGGGAQKVRHPRHPPPPPPASSPSNAPSSGSVPVPHIGGCTETRPGPCQGKGQGRGVPITVPPPPKPGACGHEVPGCPPEVPPPPPPPSQKRRGLPLAPAVRGPSGPCSLTPAGVVALFCPRALAQRWPVHTIAGGLAAHNVMPRPLAAPRP